ncbi:transglutaminase domain-containing protein [Anaerovorax sp. IOR16]|uniref:transglutaminase domain-containing protein n=1 Tax=Anaerovorax sp. IOR16 TaxID=2773458 RepID=UPI0019D1A289|nr:transglutaminase domain-containing protein [Anaerovorax sp. IOR16]
MRKTKWPILCMLILAISLAACVPTAGNEGDTGQIKAEDEKAQTIDWMEKDKYFISSQIQEIAPINNMDLYEVVYDAANAMEDEVDISAYTVSKEELQNILEIIWDKGNAEFFYLKEMPTVSQDNKSVKITYAFSKDEILELKDKFAKEVNHILNDMIDQNATDLQKQFSIYDYLLKSCTYNYDFFDNGIDMTPEELMQLSDEELEDIGEKMAESEVINRAKKYNTANAYGVIVNKKGICFGFAGALNFLYNKIGIETRVISDKLNTHSWNIVKIDGKYYHVDLTNDVDSGKNLEHFNFTDEERPNEGLLLSWNEPFFERGKEAVICNDNRFEYFRNVKDYKLVKNKIQFTDSKDGKKYVMNIDGTEKELIN